MNAPRRLVVISNRLPVTFEKSDGSYKLAPTAGGLVTALSPIMRQIESCWIGWTGTDCDPNLELQLRGVSSHGRCRLVPVFFTEEERRNFYCGFANEVIWPLFHDLQSRCTFEPVYWESYCEANEKYADVLMANSAKGDFVWVHDYQLMLVADCLHDRGFRGRLAYFHHIPFPPPDIFEKLPWRAHILRALLNFSVVGFQTARDQRNFLHCVRRFLPWIKVQRLGNTLLVRTPDHGTMIGTFPIGIDYDEFAQASETEEVAERAAAIRQTFPETMLLGVDRLDYTKGVPERLKAFRLFLEIHPEMRGKVSLLQIVVPSREDLPRYQELKVEIERTVSQINGRFGVPGWVPIHFVHRHVPRGELLACYRAADVALVTPLKDGMNLVAKEFCAAQVEQRGVLILSEFAGAADQLGVGALLINPYDTDGLVEAIAQACSMNAEERTIRMRAMREVVRLNNVFRWSKSVYHTAASKADEPTKADPKPATITPISAPVAAWKHAASAVG